MSVIKRNPYIRNPYISVFVFSLSISTFFPLFSEHLCPSLPKRSIIEKIFTQHQVMKTANSDKIFETSSVGQAPSKDFFSLIVRKDSVVWRSWKITLRCNKSLPSEAIQSWKDFEGSSRGKRLQSEIQRVFGTDTLNYVLSLVTQSWLPYLKSEIMIEILVQLDLFDIARLAQVR